ncbi:MAG: methyltransferase domain-containing protein [Caldilineaceae bacterium]|nr:methyltransferase domain-containing protein [Caldilineaceae bacterium]
MSMAHPSAYRLTYSLRRLYVDAFMAQQAAALAPRSRVLDLGGHKRAKRGEFDIGRYDLQVVYANLTVDKTPDLQANAAALPLAADSFDAVVCAELLEHVPDPRRVLVEAARVLRPGGSLVLTIPFLYPIHADPYDFGRYTDTFWRHTLAEAGFCGVEVTPQGFFFSVLVGFLKLAVNQARRPGVPGRLLRAVLTVALVAPLQAAALRLDQSSLVRRQSFLRAFTTGYGVVAARAAGPIPSQTA